MRTFEALMKITHKELWTVDANDEADARHKLKRFTDDVVIVNDAWGGWAEWDLLTIEDKTK